MVRVVSGEKAVNLLKEGGILLYPTEGVWGLGCDPWNQKAVERLCRIKKRDIDKGLILIVSEWEVARSLIALDLDENITKLTAFPTTTWLVPATAQVPSWILGIYPKVAIRWCQHEFWQKLGEQWKLPLVSTSANLSGEKAVTEFKELSSSLLHEIDGCLWGQVGGLGRASSIRDFLTKEKFRD